MKNLLVLVLMYAFSMAAGAQQSHSISQITGTATTTSVKILSANGDRNELIIVNEGSTTMRVREGSSHASEGLPIPPGGNYDPDPVPIGDIYLKIQSATGTYTIYEGGKL